VTPAALGAGLAVALGSVCAAELLALRAPRTARRGRGLALLTRLGRRLGVAPAPEALARRLAAAGAPASLTPSDVMAAKTGAALVALLAILGPATALPGRLGPALAVALPLAAASAPELWLRRRARSRTRTMATEVADVLDLLRVCVEAGRPPGAALGDVGARHRGLLGSELRRAARELALGRPSREVLGELSQRCPLEELAALSAALRRADRHGAPLAPALQALAADARAARARAVREQAAKAAPKIQLVVALLLVPAVMLLIGAALAAAFAG
jgi:tight adherence protein C